MKQLLEFLPIILFFVVYKLDGEVLSLGAWSYEFDGIFSATLVLMIATIAQVLISYALSRQLEKRLIWLLLATLAFGGLTLAFRNELFLMWKPTLFNWGLALVFGASQFLGDRNLMERTLGGQLALPKPIWRRLNVIWVSNFIVVGALNLVVAYRFSEATWVAYKLYSAIGFTLLLTIITALTVSPYLRDEPSAERP